MQDRAAVTVDLLEIAQVAVPSASPAGKQLGDLLAMGLAKRAPAHRVAAGGGFPEQAAEFITGKVKHAGGSLSRPGLC